MAPALARIQALVNEYNQILANTVNYREQWQTKTRDQLKQYFETIIAETGLKARVYVRGQIENLEAIVFDLGRVSSGLSENLENTDLKHTMVKNNGSLVYQQLFNGKLMVMFSNPHIEGYGEEKPPRSLEILRPDEVTEDLIYSHVERLINDIIEWEDFDDDDSKKKVAFQPIGFQHTTGNGQS
ncbi:MAG: hypothetical protein NVV59_10910 [Chitinophagaceae bacterium]|nr:hypothetical protein [Chitinophagaceae bacterium]